MSRFPRACLCNASATISFTDGFTNTTLMAAGVHGYGRRWVWLKHVHERPVTRGSGEDSVSQEDEDMLDALLNDDEEDGAAVLDNEDVYDGEEGKVVVSFS